MLKWNQQSKENAIYFEDKNKVLYFYNSKYVFINKEQNNKLFFTQDKEI